MTWKECFFLAESVGWPLRGTGRGFAAVRLEQGSDGGLCAGGTLTSNRNYTLQMTNSGTSAAAPPP